MTPVASGIAVCKVCYLSDNVLGCPVPTLVKALHSCLVELSRSHFICFPYITWYVVTFAV